MVTFLPAIIVLLRASRAGLSGPPGARRPVPRPSPGGSASADASLHNLPNHLPRFAAGRRAALRGYRPEEAGRGDFLNLPLTLICQDTLRPAVTGRQRCGMGRLAACG